MRRWKIVDEHGDTVLDTTQKPPVWADGITDHERAGALRRILTREFGELLYVEEDKD